MKKSESVLVIPLCQWTVSITHTRQAKVSRGKLVQPSLKDFHGAVIFNSENHKQMKKVLEQLPDFIGISVCPRK